jgi:DNA-binding MarR family transcriptional regulator
LKQGADLLFLAARDLSLDGTDGLEALGLGRAHARALTFIARNPGLSVADLLGVLKITKQSLNRVLKELLGQGYVERRAGMRDRRQRHLHLSDKGAKLESQIWEIRRPKLVRAFRDAGPEAVAGFRRVLMNLIEAERKKAPSSSGAAE